MSSIEKPNNLNLEGENDFGDTELNKLFKELDEKTQKEILSYPKKEFQIEILKNINNPELAAFYKSLQGKSKENIDKLKIRDRYFTLKTLLDVKKKKDAQAAQTEKVDKTEKVYKPVPEKKSKIAIIVPFRDSELNGPRTKQLNRLVDFMASFLAGEDYKIFVITQNDDGRKFNRGQLLNIGFKIANDAGYDIFIFHDVDLLPSKELKKYYTTYPEKQPVHIAAVWDRYGSNPNYFGGIVAFNKTMFQKVNGFPNDFWGWGGEDDELLKRFLPENIGRRLRSAVKLGLPGRDGLASLAFKVAQSRAQSVAFKQRQSVLRTDNWLEEALSFTGNSLG